MNKIFKYLISIIGVVLLAMVVFFFWASSTNHKEIEYSQLIENNYAEKINNDSIHSIITYNLGYLSGMTNNLAVEKPQALFEDNLSKVYKEFADINPDIICFQEIDYHSKRSYSVNQQNELGKLGYNHIYQAVNWDVNYLPFPYFPISAHFGEVYSGQSILSKYKLFDTERIVLERVANNPFYRDAFYLDRLAQVSKTVINDRTVVLINVHFEAFDKPTRMNHAEHIAQLYNKYQEDYPVFLVGDFNSDEAYDNAAIQLIIDIPGIKSAGHNLGKTFPSINPVDRLDYIFYNEKYIELIDAKILTSFGEASDHLPVLMDFKFK